MRDASEPDQPQADLDRLVHTVHGPGTGMDQHLTKRCLSTEWMVVYDHGRPRRWKRHRGSRRRSSRTIFIEEGRT
jgi:hypothetical protein